MPVHYILQKMQKTIECFFKAGSGWVKTTVLLIMNKGSSTFYKDYLYEKQYSYSKRRACEYAKYDIQTLTVEAKYTSI